MALMMLPLHLLLRPEEQRTLYGTLRRLFGDTLIEELPIPLYTNTSDLDSGDIQIVRRGPLWEAVALSMTIPIMLPPRPVDGRLLVDGGILEAFPVTAMADEHAGPIIGVAGASSHVTPIGADEPTLELRGTPDAKASLPSTVEQLLRVMDLVSYNCPGVRTEVDVYITPDVGTTGITEFSRLDEMIEAGRAATRRALDEQDWSGLAKRFPGEPSQVSWLLDAVEERRPEMGFLGRAAEAIDRGLLEGRGHLSAASGLVGSAFGRFGVRRAPPVSSVLDGLITEILRIPH